MRRPNVHAVPAAVRALAPGRVAALMASLMATLRATRLATRLATGVAALAVCGLVAAPPLSAEPGAPAPVRAALDRATLAGEGTLRWLGLRIYDARLWVGQRGIDPGRLDASPFALELRYARSLSGAAIAERSAVEIARLGMASEAQRVDWLARMNVLFPDVRAGDRIAGIFDPASGTRFYLNDRPIGEVADPDFARAFFSIWLDRRTAAPALRDALLGHAAAAAPAASR